MHKQSYYIINAITLYRLAAAPVLIYLIFIESHNLFKWLLAVSFFTDLIDGFLARKYKVTSIMGSRLDSAADDLNIVAAIIGLFVLKPQFIQSHLAIFITLFALLVLQNIFALIRYRKITSFHTYLAKLAAILQGVFLILSFFLPEPNVYLFYIAAIVTAIELIEETILVTHLPVWKANVKGLYWVLKKRI